MAQRISKTVVDVGQPMHGSVPSFGNGVEPPQDVLQALPAAVYTTDAAGRLTFYNEAAAKLWGSRPELGSAQWCGSWRLFWPDGRPMPHDECPMAIALKQGRALKGAEAVAERPDGSRVPFLAYPTPLRDAAGAITGAVNMLVDISERKLAEISKQLLAAIVESSDDVIVSKDLNGTITSWNRGAERVFGYTSEEAVGKPIMMLIPPDRQAEEAVILDRIRRGERVDHYETVRRRKDGGLVDVALTVSPVRNIEGRVVGASKIARDITERKRFHEKQSLLLREMNHRIKNLFALASGLVSLSARAARTPGDLAKAILERLRALSYAHELTLPLLTEEQEKFDRQTTLQALLCAIVSPYVNVMHECDDRITTSGPDVPIGGKAATGLALLLHEFATNAVKYGALSAPQGRVKVDWSLHNGELLLQWEEHGGPLLSGPPEAEGFGSVLTRATVELQLGGRISRDWKRDGLVIQLSVPRGRLAT